MGSLEKGYEMAIEWSSEQLKNLERVDSVVYRLREHTLRSGSQPRELRRRNDEDVVERFSLFADI